MTPVDLRSDTVTRPTPEMYAAMQAAEVGDDVLRDDPTVARLERLAAERVGMEDALFVPTGTMGNQIALACHCRPGDAILVEEEAHLVYYEVGGSALIAGVVSWTLPSNRGVMDPEQIQRRLLRSDLHTPGTTLLCVENTHNRAGGTVVRPAMLAAYREIADRHGIRVHMDGARVFNAAVALGVPVRELTRHVDSVSFCLSKGLCAPVGSVLCGTRTFIEDARRWRKRLGGGMRQAGILAACGIVGLERLVDRLADDHRRAKALAAGISELPGLRVRPDDVETNLVLVGTDRPAAAWQADLEAHGVRCFPVAPNRLRLVLHADVDDTGVARAVEAFGRIAAPAYAPSVAGA